MWLTVALTTEPHSSAFLLPHLPQDHVVEAFHHLLKGRLHYLPCLETASSRSLGLGLRGSSRKSFERFKAWTDSKAGKEMLGLGQGVMAKSLPGALNTKTT